MPSALDTLRAVLVAMHVVAVVGMSLPSPDGFRAGDPLANPKIARPLAEWEASLASVGVPPQATRAVALGGGRALETVEDAAERVFRPYVRYAGVDQSWRMFSASPARSWRLEIHLEQGAWRAIYRPFDPDARWRAELWEDGRVRGMVASLANAKFQEWWRALAESAARRAALDFPDATRLRIQRVPLRFPAPERMGTVVEGEPVGVVEIEL